MAEQNRGFSNYEPRNLKIHVPRYKLHFVDHPRYGKVYPFVSYDHTKNYFTLPLGLAIFHGLWNTIFMYGACISPIFTPAAASFVCNPMFLIPSLYYNYCTLSKYYIFLYGARSHCQNLFLKPGGK